MVPPRLTRPFAGITWTWFTGAECPLYNSDTMKWSGDEDACKAACLEDENCKGFVFYSTSENGFDCHGKTDTCADDEYVVSDGAVTYVFSRGM